MLWLSLRDLSALNWQSIVRSTYAPAWWRRRLLSNIPKLPGDKLSKDALLAVGRSLGALGPLVRLPGEHGVLVTDPSLAKRLLEHGGGAVVREMTAYERYGGFLGGSLVLLPQATPAHRTLRSALLPDLDWVN